MKLFLSCLLLAWLSTALAHHTDPAGGGANSAQSARAKAGLGSGVAFAPDGRLWLAGVDADGALFIQSSADRGSSWSAPRRLDIGGEQVSADGENRPKIAFGPNGLAVVAYTRPLAKPYTGEIRLLRSVDGGRTFSPPQTVHQDRQIITHRFESLAFDGAGHLHVVWIDKRDLVAAGKNSSYAGAAIYRAESADGGRTFGPDIKVADHSCECCRIALAPAPDGRLVALWRHVFPGNVRDHAFARLDDDAPPAVRASFDQWQLDACPHHGPGLAPAAGGGYHAVWFGERAGVAAVRYGRLGVDGGIRGDARALPDSQAEHADVLADGDRLAIVWRSFDGSRTRLRAWVSRDGGEHFELRELAATRDENDHPRLVRDSQGLLAVWRTRKEIHVLPIEP